MRANDSTHFLELNEPKSFFDILLLKQANSDHWVDTISVGPHRYRLGAVLFYNRSHCLPGLPT